MKSILLLLAMALPVAGCASDDDRIAKLLVALDDEDFDVREHAMLELGDFPEEYSKKFLEMSRKYENPELRERLYVAARMIFKKSILIKTDEWLKFHGTLGIEGNLRYHQLVHTNPDGTSISDWVPLGFMITFVSNENAKEQLNGSDIIIEIADVDLNVLDVKAGHEYELKIRRYKDITQLENYYQRYTNDYEEFTIKVRAGWKDERFINPYAAEALMLKLWFEFKDGPNAQKTEE